MFNFPSTTDVLKQLPKTAFYKKFKLDSQTRNSFDNDISKMFVIHEISKETITIEGKDIQEIFIIRVDLKKQNFNDKNLLLFLKSIKQNLLLVLKYEEKYKVVIYHKKMMQTKWENEEDLPIKLQGNKLDDVWENFITQIGDFEIEEGNTLEEQLEKKDEKEKIEKEIKKLEKKRNAEKQMNKKFDLTSQIGKLKKKLQGLLGIK